MADSFSDTALVYRDTAAAGPAGGSAGLNKLWLPLWSGEVINAYDQYNVFENMITTKSISGGFAYEFPITGTVELQASWDAGEELMGGDAKSTTIKVALDKRPMAAHFETDNIDLLVTQWDYRSELARQAGLQLANTRDRQIAMALVAAGSLETLGSVDPRGIASAGFHIPGEITNAATPAGLPASCSEANALSILQEIENYLVTCQENDIAVSEVYCAVTPKVFQVIRALGIPRSGAAATAFVAGTYASTPIFSGGPDYGGAGANISAGMNTMNDSLDYMGVKIIKTNHLPKIDHAGSAIGSSKYNLTCNGFGLFGVIFQKEAIAGLSLQGMKVDTVEDVRRNTQFTVASMMKGTGVIRPEMVKLLTAGATSGATNTRAKMAALLSTTTAANWTGGFFAEYAVTG